MKIEHPSKTRSERREMQRSILRKTIALLLLLLFMVPMLGGGVQPLWVIPATVCICMYENMYFCMFSGVLAGLSIDIACDGILGANAIYMVCCCTAASLFFEKLLRRKFINFFAITLVITLLRSVLHYLLTVVLFRMDGRDFYWSEILLPSSIWTMIVSIPVYLFYLPSSRLLTKRVKSMDAAAVHRD